MKCFFWFHKGAPVLDGDGKIAENLQNYSLTIEGEEYRNSSEMKI